MAIFKDHNIKVKQLLGFIPEALIANLSQTTRIDNKSGKKAVKYSIAFDGILPCHSNVFTSPKYGNEDNALLEVVMDM
ncbi:hypothetical protein [Daejeonella sp.]|uniref:hypothetical protein n=1 Tax=Daejeonella sp. TaxID=2805397 RepID=UPI0027274FDB|nr:hypothetical protein [Daejeonella sp.]MDO8991480.1 hypothetical protein [Daejeonella sp.]MDP2415776.1 hypothetical protein [Daejeonella sp.]